MYHMGLIKLRTVPELLHKRLKAEAALAGSTLEDWCVSKLGGESERSGGESVGSAEVSAGGDEGRRHLNGLAVSFLRSTPEPAERLRQVPTMRGELVGGHGPDEEPTREACTYREYDPESGEWYGCALSAHGPKVRHVRGGKV